MGEVGKLPGVARTSYSVGAMPFGMKDTGISFLLLLFYNQVMGLPASAVGLVLMITLILDSLTDPLIGQMSDSWKSKWGRRHPFLYLASLLIAPAYYLLWSPPAGWGGEAILAYLLVVTVAVRVIISLYEVPSAALLAELTSDYVERSRLMGSRLIAAWIGGVVAMVTAYMIFLTPSAAQPVGQLNPDGYRAMGLAHGILMATAMLVSAMGTHSRIPFLHRAAEQHGGIRETMSGIIATLRNRSLLVVVGTGMLTGLAVGLSNGLSIYLHTFLWDLKPQQIAWISLTFLIGAAAGVFVAPRLSRRYDKRQVAIGAGVVYVVLHSLPVCLRAMGLFPENGTTLLLASYTVIMTGAIAMILIVSTMTGSMLADTVEDNEIRTGRRAEGVTFSAQLFTQKCISGFGVFGAGLILSAVGFPEGAKPGDVDADLVIKLALTAVAVHVICYLAGMGLLGRYRISRDRHEENLRLLRERDRNLVDRQGMDDARSDGEKQGAR